MWLQFMLRFNLTYCTILITFMLCFQFLSAPSVIAWSFLFRVHEWNSRMLREFTDSDFNCIEWERERSLPDNYGLLIISLKCRWLFLNSYLSICVVLTSWLRIFFTLRSKRTLCLSSLKICLSHNLKLLFHWERDWLWNEINHRFN